jgi:hypothetical protein
MASTQLFGGCPGSSFPAARLFVPFGAVVVSWELAGKAEETGGIISIRSLRFGMGFSGSKAPYLVVEFSTHTRYGALPGAVKEK